MNARLRNGNVKILGPVKAFIGIKPPGIADGGRVFERVGDAFGKVARFERLMAAHVDDDLREADAGRTGLSACAAGRAGPEGVARDDVV